MYGMVNEMCPKNHPNVGKYTIHGAYGCVVIPDIPGQGHEWGWNQGGWPYRFLFHSGSGLTLVW